MPKSQFVAASTLKPLLTYTAAAFLVVLIVGTLVPPGRVREVAVLFWLVCFPVGGWLVFRWADR